MEFNKLKGSAIIIVVLSIIVIMSLAILQGFSESTRTRTTTAVNGITLEANGTQTDIGTTGQYPFIQSVTGCINSTNGSIALSTSYYTVQEGDADGGGITLTNSGSSWTGETINCSSIIYLADSSSQSTADAFIEGLSIIATFIAVLVLAIIGKTIIGLFKKD